LITFCAITSSKLGPRQIEQHHAEFVAAQAGDRVHAAHAGLDAGSGFRQQTVAGRVAEGVVDDLETIEIDEQHRAGGTLALGLLHRLPEAVPEQVSVRQSRHRIELGEKGELFLRVFALDRHRQYVRDGPHEIQFLVGKAPRVPVVRGEQAESAGGAEDRCAHAAGGDVAGQGRARETRVGFVVLDDEGHACRQRVGGVTAGLQRHRRDPTQAAGHPATGPDRSAPASSRRAPSRCNSRRAAFPKRAPRPG
jgi:hypothetical protein